MQKLKLQISKINIGIWYTIFAVFMGVLAHAIIKAFLQDIPSIEVMLFRSLFGILILFVSIKHIPVIQNGNKLWLLLFRAFVGVFNMYIAFFLVTKIPLANVTIFVQTTVIWGAIFSLIFLKERLNFIQIIAIMIGFLGILFIVDVNIKFDKYSILAVFVGMSSGLAAVSLRGLKDYYNPRVITLVFMTIVFIVSSICILIGYFVNAPDLEFIFPKFVMIDITSLFLIAVMSIFATLAQVYRSKAYVFNKTGIVGTVGYVRIVFAIVIGMILGDSFPDLMTLLGIIFIVSSGIMVAYKKKSKL